MPHAWPIGLLHIRQYDQTSRLDCIELLTAHKLALSLTSVERSPGPTDDGLKIRR